MRQKPKKSLGQNFLNDKYILNLISKLGSVNNKSIILEIGPGTGNLTEKLLEQKPKKLFLIEKDKNLYNDLKNKFINKVEVINDDFLNFDIGDFFKEKITIFGNLPYNISSQILIKLIRLKNLEKKIYKLIFMFQKEVADRIIANENSKQYGRLSIISSWKLDVKKITDVDPNSFYPKPKVKSTILIMEPKKKYLKLKSPKNLEHITNVFFNLRRKKIKKPLKILFKNYEEIANLLMIDLNLRPQNLSPSIFLKICLEYEKLTN